MEEGEIFFEGIQVTDFIDLENLKHVSKLIIWYKAREIDLSNKLYNIKPGV